MSIDTELGMPLELGQINPGSFGDGKYWMGNRSGASLALLNCSRYSYGRSASQKSVRWDRRLRYSMMRMRS